MSMHKVQFAVLNEDENRIMQKILRRAEQLGVKNNGSRFDAMSLEMDLLAVHARTPLRLDDLANSGSFTFLHDVLGIVRHLNRRTGLLENCFVPRSAARGM